jgi:hypothetical protein
MGDNTSLGIAQTLGVHSIRDRNLATLTSILEAARLWTLRRIRSGETHVKSHYFLSCYLKYVFAREQGDNRSGIEEGVATEAVTAAKRCLGELKAVAQARGLPSGISEQAENQWDSPLPEQGAFLDSSLNVPDFGFGDAPVDAMGMDWMGDWPLDDMAELANFSWANL